MNRLPTNEVEGDLWNMDAWWSRLHPTKRALAVLLLTFVAGGSTVMALGAWIGLPSDVSAVEANDARQDSVIERVEVNIRRVEQRQQRTLCLVESLALDTSPYQCQ